MCLLMNNTYTHLQRQNQTHTLCMYARVHTRTRTQATLCLSLGETVRKLRRVGGQGRCSQRFLQTELTPVSASLQRHFTPNPRYSASVSVKAEPMKCL